MSDGKIKVSLGTNIPEINEKPAEEAEEIPSIQSVLRQLWEVESNLNKIPKDSATNKPEDCVVQCLGKVKGAIQKLTNKE